MTCPKCGSENVTVTIEQTGGKTHTKGNGCLWKIGRWTLIVCTCGLWLLAGRHKSTSKTQFASKTVCLCQSCGKKWYK